MSNRNLSIGRSFWLQTSYLRFQTMRDLEVRTEPEPFLTASSHRGHVPLSRETVRELGTVEPLHQLRQGTHLAPLVKLTTLLHNALGLVRYEYGSVRPFHRGAPSARCLYSTELYVIPADSDWLGEEGIYRYDPLMHALERIDLHTNWDVLENALGRSLAGAEGVLVVGADFWRIARLYADFAYNIASLEAGHVIAQLNMIATRLGYTPTVHEQFLDQDLMELLGMNEDVKTPLAVIVLWPQATAGESPKRELVRERKLIDMASVSTRFEREMNQCADLQQMMKASRLTSRVELELPEIDSSGVTEELVHTSASCVELVQRSTKSRHPDLLEALKSRNSANDRIGLNAVGRPLPFAELSGLLCELAANPEAIELAQEVGLYLAAHRVEGLQSGIYRCDLSVPALCTLTVQEDVGRAMERASVVDGKFINFRSIPLSFYFAVDLERTLQKYGNRGYQILLMKVGRLAQSLCLLAAARGWFARPLKSYRDAEAEEMLGIAQSTQIVAYQLVMGESDTPYLEFDMGL
ncbi:hypothetical protein CIG75_10985 [Tumebacillus algifaecis]|uniref:Nitroreductase domain-containing protein n=1 Tax=Tumebacillus algifaecis TaxID=1214604 RepID=A0A223D249_9BACL|nr:SagB family peptide dehydrogenase [Tumebacillus algifaecis]ASS75447.1 hypothetical protein CIG75_10985 [Tumebacillus algifaecis]